MITSRYKSLFALRFVAYFSLILGFLGIGFQFGPIAQAEFNYRKDQILGVSRTVTVGSNNQATSSALENEPERTAGQSGFESLDTSESVIKPVSTDYGIVIEKINANAAVVPDVDPADEKAYSTALAKGVVAAKGSTNPGEPGNLYIFSHSVDAPWNISRFNAVFYLLRELETGDRVIVFYQGKRYNYEVYDKNVAEPTDLSFLVNRYDKPVLTLQTCDPPGTLLRRLIVRAKLIGS